MTEPRRWRVYAGRVDQPVEGREFMNFGDERAVRFHGREPVAVEVTEDPDGTYHGWIPRAQKTPIMIEPHPVIFHGLFPHGPEVEQEMGRGEIVRLSVREVQD